MLILLFFHTVSHFFTFGGGIFEELSLTLQVIIKDSREPLISLVKSSLVFVLVVGGLLAAHNFFAINLKVNEKTHVSYI